MVRVAMLYGSFITCVPAPGNAYKIERVVMVFYKIKKIQLWEFFYSYYFLRTTYLRNHSISDTEIYSI